LDRNLLDFRRCGGYASRLPHYCGGDPSLLSECTVPVAQAAASSGRGPGLENAEAQADSPCSEKPSTPEKRRDVGKGQAIPAEFNKLFETGEFQLGYCLAEVRVNEKGTVDSVRLLRPENVDMRVESVIVREITPWRYRPATACGRSVLSTTSVGFFHCPFKGGSQPAEWFAVFNHLWCDEAAGTLYPATRN
jgi:hypothetical protein